MIQRRTETIDRSRYRRERRAGLVVASAAVSLGTGAPVSFAQLTGQTGAHDPSTLAIDGPNYYYFSTGQGILTRSSTDKVAWSGGSPVFATPPAWTTQSVPNFTGLFWAPDVAYFNGKYHLYYSASSWGALDSAIGVATSPSLNNPTWTDQGKVVQSNSSGQAGPSTDTTAYNAIDPSILVDDATGRVWMTFGSYFSGIVVTEINPSTGKRLSSGPLSATMVANSNPGGGGGSTIEASALTKRGNYYYLFVNYGTCCSGVDSTYNIRVGRSTTPTGPFFDKNGVDMRNGGGTLFLDDDGKMIGPGHFSYHTEAGQDYFGYHYYNGDTNGTPTYGLRKLYWTADAWPSYAAVNPNWTGSASGGWSSGLNWGVSPVPNAAGHIANFGPNAAGRYVVSLDGVGRTLSTANFSGSSGYTIGTTTHILTLDALPGDAATLNVHSGTHTIAAPINALDRIGVNVVSGGRLNLTGSITGTGLTKYGYGTVALGGTITFTDPVFVKWGAVEITGSVTTGGFTSIGQGAAEGGAMLLRGTGSYTANGDLNVGDTGNSAEAATGRLDLYENSKVTVNAAGGFYVGSGFQSNTRATGTVHHHGGTLAASGNFDGAFIIGGRNSSLGTGTYNLYGGTVNANTNVQVGGRGTGTLYQSGGTFNANSFVSVGRRSGATGSWTITGGTLNQASASANLIVGEDGAGTLTVGGNATVNLANALRVGLTGSGSGTVYLNGGTLTTTHVSTGSGTATLSFNGGTLRASAATTTFVQGLTSARVQLGGAVIDTQGFAVTVGQPLLHDPTLGATPDGGVGKFGPGTLTLAGNNTYTGPTTVFVGELILRPAARTTVLNGAAGANVVGGRLVFDYAGGTSPQAQVVPLLAESYSLGWDGGRMRSTAADSLHGLGWIDDATASRLVVMYTLYGDANLDGRVNGDDYTLLDRGDAMGLAGWRNGDFNYDGSVGQADYLLADLGFASQSGQPLSSGFLAEREARFGRAYMDQLVLSVPEPSLYAVALIVPIVCPGRRRRWGTQRPGRSPNGKRSRK